MTFIYAREKKKFDAAWEQLAKTYAEAGMTPEAIQEIYEFDWNAFKAARIEARHSQEMDAEDHEAEDWESPLFKNHQDAITCEYDTYGSHSRYWWLEEIENPCVVVGLPLLTDEDKEILTLFFVERCTETEIAHRFGTYPMKICRRLQKILNYFSEKC